MFEHCTIVVIRVSKSGDNRLILVCRIHINTCNFVNYIMKITYYGLEDVGVILAGAKILLFVVYLGPHLPFVQCILGLFFTW